MKVECIEIDALDNIEDEELYMYSEYVYKSEGYSDPMDFLSNVIGVEYYANPTFMDILAQYLGTKGKDLSDIRGYMPYKKGFLMCHGCNYDWFSADLLCASDDGTGKREFFQWCNDNDIDLIR